MLETSQFTDAQYIEAILDAAVDAIICTNDRGIIELFNKAAEGIFQYKADEVIGKSLNILMTKKQSINHDAYIKNYKKTGVKKMIGIGREDIAVKKDGTEFPIDISVAETFVHGRRIFAGIIRDITERKKNEDELRQHRNHLQELVEQRTQELSLLNRELEKLANLDGLTKIANRRNFDETLQKEIKRAMRYKHPISLMMCDIDYFKQYNDTYGHLSGDKCLKKVAACLKKSFKRASDLPARYGGEEFAVILPHSDSKEAYVMCEQFAGNIRELKIAHDASSISDIMTLSIGLATVNMPDNNMDIKSLVNVADEQLYLAKSNGRNRIETTEL